MGDRRIRDADGAFVVTVQRCRGLRMPEIFENGPLVCGDSGRRKNPSVFCFGDKRAYNGNFSRMGRDGVVYPRVVEAGAEKMVGARNAAGVRSRKIRGVR